MKQMVSVGIEGNEMSLIVETKVLEEHDKK